MSDTRQSVDALMAYWHTPAGQAVWQRESIALARMVQYKGGRLLEMNTAASLSSPFKPCLHVRWAPSLQTQPLWQANYIADGRAQPFDDCYFDTVLIHHLLDCVATPHHWLSEAARITADTGRLYLVCWNPLHPRWPSRKGHHPAQRRLFVRQIRDWLAFVDLEIEQVHYCAFSAARCHSASWAERIGTLLDLPLAGSYIVSARRQKQYIVPLAKRLRHRQLLGLGAIPQGMLAPMPSTLPERHHAEGDAPMTHSIYSRPSGHHEQH